MEKDHSIKTTTAKGATISHGGGGGGKIPYDHRLAPASDITNSNIDTPNMSGHQLEDGTRSLRTGKPIQR